MMNPGYGADRGAAPWDPHFTGVPDLGLVDYIVAVRLFNFYMVNACRAGAHAGSGDALGGTRARVWVQRRVECARLGLF
jgi:hypothetical protein